MSNFVTLTQDQVGYIAATLANAASLMDDVHCYETPQQDACYIAQDVLLGMSVEVATAKHEKENL